MYYDKDGRKLGLFEWAKLMENFEYKVIKQDTLPDGKWVSTVWLGNDHNFSGKGPILIFETMVFSRKGGYNELDMDRYSTLEEAKAGHEKMVEKYKSLIKN